MKQIHGGSYIMNKHRDKIKILLSSLMVVVTLMGLFTYMKSTGILDLLTSPEGFERYIESCGEKAYLMFFIIQFISVIIAPIPSNVSAVIGGSVFGMWESFLISSLAILSGSIVVFILGRKLGKPFTDKFISAKISSKYQEYFSSKKGELLLILLLFLPFLPDDAIGFVAGLSKIKLGKYIVMMLLTRPWEILAASALGSSGMAIPFWGWALVALFILIIAKNSDKIEKKLVNLVKLS
jgi:uncharacterized membrane protein YdjX (TVP38/TMEM64 family)